MAELEKLLYVGYYQLWLHNFKGGSEASVNEN